MGVSSHAAGVSSSDKTKLGSSLVPTQKRAANATGFRVEGQAAQPVEP
jgi:hypothetical protein